MSNIDERIRNALADETDDFKSLPNIAEELIGTFKGQSKWLNIFTAILTFVFFGGWIWTTIEFFQATSIDQKLEWGGASLFCLIFISFMKVWFWLTMQSNRVIREVKRLELLHSKHLN